MNPIYRLDNAVFYQKSKQVCVALIVFCSCLILVACNDHSDTSELLTQQGQPIVDAEFNISDDYVPATMIPPTEKERRLLLNQINSQTVVEFEQQRLSLFVRFAMLANSQKPTLSELDLILNELTQLVSEHNQDVELSALLGSVTSFKSVFYSGNSGKQSLLAKKGMRLLDRAVKKSDKHLGVRLQRGISYASMPSFLGRAHLAVADLSLIKQAIREDNPKFTVMVDFYLGKALLNDQQTSNGMNVLKLVVEKKLEPWSQLATELISERS
jgi:hypothetical protein